MVVGFGSVKFSDGLAQLQFHSTFGGSSDGRLWVKGGRRPVVGWLPLVVKTNQKTTNGRVGQFTPVATVEPKAGSPAALERRNFGRSGNIAYAIALSDQRDIPKVRKRLQRIH
jgi:hypothetical protein